MATKQTHSKHAKHAPSSLGYKEACPSWCGRSGTNPAAEEGTMLHAALERDDFSGLNEEQEFVCGLCRDFREGEVSTMESPVIYKELSLSICGGLTRGTADFVAVDSSRAILMDWKFGRSEVEPARTNAQGCAYALGVFERFPEVQTLELHFVQPRTESISSHTFRRSDMQKMALRIMTIIRRANARNKEEHPGMHCRYCRKQARCVALRNLALPIASQYADFPEELHASNISDPRMMARCLDCAKILKEWADAVNFHAADMAANGIEIPGYKLTTRAGRRTIPDALAAYGMLQDRMSLEDYLSCCGSVSIDALTDKVSAHAPRGEKQKTKDALVSDLIGEGIITQAAPTRYMKRS